MISTCKYIFQQQYYCQQNDDCHTSGAATDRTGASCPPLGTAVAADERDFSGAEQSQKQTPPAEEQQSETAASGAVTAPHSGYIQRTADRTAAAA